LNLERERDPAGILFRQRHMQAAFIAREVQFAGVTDQADRADFTRRLFSRSP